LRDLHRRKDEFLAMLGHELRNPLAPLRGAAALLRESAGDGRVVAELADLVDRQARQMTRLVEELLDTSRVSGAKVHLRRERLDFGRLVRSAAADARPAIEEAGLSLALEAPDGPVWVVGDAVRLTQVVGNLLTNAVKFTDAGGRVEVHVAADGQRRRAVLAVRDSGIGIEAHVLPRLFEAFAQADRSVGRSRGGLGLGLALVRGLVELHGGEVGAASEGPGRGSEFTVWLPLAG
jgi:signal transduction histidine kinase